MTLKTVSWVAPDLNEWPNPQKQGTITYYVNVAFSDDDRGSIGKENKAKAEELKALLEGLLDKEADFGLKDSGKKTDDGGTKWNLLSFPGYEPEPFVGGGGAKKEYIPRYTDTQEGYREESQALSRRRALEMAVALFPQGAESTALSVPNVRAYADIFFAWLTDLAPASPGTATSGEPKAAALSPAAGVNSSAGVEPIPGSSGDPSDGGGEETLAFGEGTSGSNPAPSEHAHEWFNSKTLKTFEVCACGDTRKKAAA